MKKLSMAMAAVMLFVSCFVFTVSAADSVKIAVTTPATVEKGGELTVSVDFSENTGFNTLGVKLTYPEGFTYVDDSEAVSALIAEKCYLEFGGYEGETYAFSHNEAARTLTFVGASLYDITETSGTIFTVKFTAPETAGSGEFKVEIVDEAYNADEEVVSVDKVNGTVTVSGGQTYKKGDVNMDGKVNAVDAIRILRYDAGLETLTAAQLELANVAGTNATVNAADAIKILRADAGLETIN